MNHAVEAELGDAERIAIGYLAEPVRAKFVTVFALDRRLAQIVAKTSEPMLGQIRLAWWRDVLQQPVKERPSGDVVLDSLSEHFCGSEEALISLIDGWEHMLAEAPLSKQQTSAFIEGRVDALGSITLSNADANLAVRRWACADATVHTSNEREREQFIELGLLDADRKVELPRSYRGLAILNALALRSMEKGGSPLFDGRTAALIAFRVGIIGR